MLPAFKTRVRTRVAVRKCRFAALCRGCSGRRVGVGPRHGAASTNATQNMNRAQSQHALPPDSQGLTSPWILSWWESLCGREGSLLAAQQPWFFARVSPFGPLLVPWRQFCIVPVLIGTGPAALSYVPGGFTRAKVPSVTLWKLGCLELKYFWCKGRVAGPTWVQSVGYRFKSRPR